MPDTPTRTDTPPPPPEPPERSLRPSPEMQQKLDNFRARKEARQDAGLAVDHRAAKAENQAARNAPNPENAARRPQRRSEQAPGVRQRPENVAPDQQRSENGVAARQRGVEGNRPPRQRPGESEAAARRPENAGRNGSREPLGLRPSPEFQQKLDDFRARKEARQDAGLAVDHRATRAENQARRGENQAARVEGQRVGDPRAAAKQGSSAPREAQHLNPADDLRRQPRREGNQERVEPRHRADYSAETGQRLSELRNEGHGPQRHHDITDDKLVKRLGTPVINESGNQKLTNKGFVESTNKIDPETNSTRDADADASNPERKHRCEPVSSRMDSGDDYVVAEKYLRQRVPETGFPIARAPISEVLGPDAHQRMTGVYLDPANPGQVKPANFEDGNIVAVYNRARNGDLTLRTMYPEPAPFQP